MMSGGSPARDMSGGREPSVRIQVSFRREELSQIDNWRFDTRKDNRSHAIRELVRIGLKFCADEKKKSGIT